MAKFSKPVAFNEKNEKDRLMLQHVKRRNFSGYVKKLIWEDMSLNQEVKIHTKEYEQPEVIKKEVIQEQTVKPTPVPKQPTASERIQQLKTQTKKQQTSSSPLPFIPSNPQRY
ncbi:TPA: hypothetical protein QCX65_005948 [Bacillus mycoides]|nr:hypothetical protein [Bacillus mycoides]